LIYRPSRSKLAAGGFSRLEFAMANILNLPGLTVLEVKETATEIHVRTVPAAISRMCPHCGRSHETIGHGKLQRYVREAWFKSW